MTVSSTLTYPAIGTPSLTRRAPNLFFQDMEDDIEFCALSPEEFADSNCQYYFASVGKTIQLNGIFDDEYWGADPDLEVDVESSQPVFICQTSKIIYQTSENDTLTIRGKRYHVKIHQPDGTGVTVIILHDE